MGPVEWVACATICVVGMRGQRAHHWCGWFIGIAVTLAFGTACSAAPPPPVDQPSSAPSTGTSGSAAPAPEAAEVAGSLQDLVTQPEVRLSKNAGVTAQQARAVFPTGTTVAADPTSWRPDGTGVGGVIEVSVSRPGKKPASYLAVMVKEDGIWRVLGTLPVENSPSPKATR